MMLDDDVVAVSPASVYRVLKQANRLDRRRFSPSKKGTGFVQPLVSHEHWHVDVSYINVSGMFYYLTSVLDSCSRYIVHWEIRESMTDAMSRQSCSGRWNGIQEKSHGSSVTMARSLLRGISRSSSG